MVTAATFARCTLALALTLALAGVRAHAVGPAVGRAAAPGRTDRAMSPSYDPDVGDLDGLGAPRPPPRRALRRRDDDFLVLPSALPAGVDADATLAPASGPSGTSGHAGARAERSANLSHVAGAGRKIMMYVRNRHLQILPDGTVNGTEHEGSDYAVLQRTSVNKVQVKMQGIATCLFLCMDACGLLYGSKELTDDCVFNEMLEQHYYNSYSSAKYSTTGPRGKSLYLALDKRGAPRRVQLKRDAPHGRLAAYTRVLTKPVAAERVADLLGRLRGAGAAPHFRHRGHHAACPPHGHPEATPRRPNPRRCPRPHAPHAPHAQPGPRKAHGAVVTRRRPAPAAPVATPAVPAAAPKPPVAAAPVAIPMHPGLLVAPPPQTPAAARHQGQGPRRKCEATEDEDLCHKRLQMIAAKKRKSRNEKKHHGHQKRPKVAKKVVAASTPAPRTTSSLAPFTAFIPTSTSTTPAHVQPVPAAATAELASDPATSPHSTHPKQDSGEGPEALPASTEASEEEDGDDDQEEHDDAVTMTTEVAATTVSLEDVLGTAVAPGLADGPYA